MNTDEEQGNTGETLNPMAARFEPLNKLSKADEPGCDQRQGQYGERCTDSKDSRE